MTQFNQQVYSASATESGLMLFPLVIGMSLMSGLVGEIVSRTGRYKVFIAIGFLVATAGIQQSPLPVPVKTAQLETFDSQQREFSGRVTESFAKSLGNVFLLAAGFMGVAFVAALFMREKVLSED